MGKYFYSVSSPTSDKKEYFEFRDSAVAFIVDEFAMANAFRYDDEGDRLTEYLKTNDETPNQYPYKYVIEKISISREYDTPKKLYVVTLDCIDANDCQPSCGTWIYNNYDDARKSFDELAKYDAEENSTKDGVNITNGDTLYERWSNQHPFAMEHYSVRLVTYEDNGNEIKRVPISLF